jgi:hypothetical protein
MNHLLASWMGWVYLIIEIFWRFDQCHSGLQKEDYRDAFQQICIQSPKYRHPHHKVLLQTKVLELCTILKNEFEKYFTEWLLDDYTHVWNHDPTL